MPSLAEQAVSRVKLGGEDFYAFYSPFQETDGVYIQFIPARELFLNTELSVQYSIIFTVTVLDRTITYQADQIRIVLPEETDELAVVDGKDYATLVTCTPYGINTHRLLVRGSRTENLPEEESEAEGNEAGKAGEEPAWPPYLWAAPVLGVILPGAVTWRRKKRGK